MKNCAVLQFVLKNSRKIWFISYSETAFCDKSIGIRYTNYCHETVQNNCFPNILRHFVGLVVKNFNVIRSREVANPKINVIFIELIPSCRFVNITAHEENLIYKPAESWSHYNDRWSEHVTTHLTILCEKFVNILKFFIFTSHITA